MNDKCANCHTELTQDAKFCSACGQSTRSFRRPFVAFVKESFHELLDIDGRLSLTIKTLLLKPGLASYEYDLGKRNKYTPPLRLYLAISLVFFLLLSSFQHIYSGHASPESITTHYSRAMFVLFPLFALLVKVFYGASYYLSNLVFSIHLHCMAYLVLMVIAPLEAFERNHLVLSLLQLPPSLYFVWYFAVAFKTMFRQSWWLSAAKALGIFTIYMGAMGIVFDVFLMQ